MHVYKGVGESFSSVTAGQKSRITGDWVGEETGQSD